MDTHDDEEGTGSSEESSEPRPVMTGTEERELKKGSGCGLAIVIALAAIFFLLLIAVVSHDDPSPAPQSTLPSELYVVPLRLRIRVQPNAKSPVVDQATRGEQLKVLESRGAWVRVETARRLSGWAERNALEREEARNRRLTRVAAIRKLPPLEGLVRAKAPLYAGPGLFFPVVGELQRDVRVRVYTRDHDFYAIEYEKEIAYASVDAVDVSAPGTRQLDVAASDVPAAPSEPLPPPTETALDAPTDIATTTEPDSFERPEKGVYSSVPAGGTDPEVIRRAVPVYPPAARRAGVGGTVVLRGIVRRDGSIDELRVVKDLPYGLGEAARKAVERWRFRPATHNGEAIDVYYTVTVNYRLSE